MAVGENVIDVTPEQWEASKASDGVRRPNFVGVDTRLAGRRVDRPEPIVTPAAPVGGYPITQQQAQVDAERAAAGLPPALESGAAPFAQEFNRISDAQPGNVVRGLRQAGSNLSAAADAFSSHDPAGAQYRQQQADERAKRVVGAPATDDEGRLLEGLVTGTAQAGPGLAAASAAGVPLGTTLPAAAGQRAAGAVQGVAPRLAGVASGVTSTAAGAAEFSASSVAPQAVASGRLEDIPKAAAAPFTSLAHLDTPEGMINAAFLIFGGVKGYRDLSLARQQMRERAAVVSRTNPAAARAIREAAAKQNSPHSREVVAAFDDVVHEGAFEPAQPGARGATAPPEPAPTPATGSTIPAVAPKPTPGGVPGSSKPFQAIPTPATLPVEQPPAVAPTQTPPTAPAPQTGGKPIQETASGQSAVGEAAPPVANDPRPGGVGSAPQTLPVEDAPPVAGVGAAAEAAPKRPWEMTKAEHLRRRREEAHPTGQYNQRTDEIFNEDHLTQVQQAIFNGRPVPASVLADYPDLKQPATGNKTKPVEAPNGEATALAPGDRVTVKGFGDGVVTKSGEKVSVTLDDGRKRVVSPDVVTKAQSAKAAMEPVKVDRSDGRIRVTGPDDVLKKIESEGEGFVRKGNTLTGFGGDSPKGKKNNAVVDKYSKGPKSGEPGTIDPGNRTDLSDVKGDEGGAVPLEMLTNIAGGAAKAIGDVSNFVAGQMINALRTPTARQRTARVVVIRALDDIEAQTSSLVGKVANDATNAVKGLSRSDRKWLQELDADGHSNFQRMMEDVGSGGRVTPPTPTLQALHDAYRKMMDVTGDEAIAKDIQKINAKGDVVPFSKAPDGRFLRHFTPDASEAMFYRGGPTYEAMARELARLNPGVTLKDAKEYMNEYLGPEAVRHVGAIEDVRRIKDIPSSVEITPGKGDWVPILETDPLPAIMNAARSQAQRIYFGSRFGQGLKGEPTKIDRLRAQFVQQGGNPRAFDDVITVFHRRPYKRVFQNPRHWANRTLRVLNQMISVAHTSMSAIPNLPQTLQTIETVGLRAWARGMAKVIMHPRLSSAQFAAMGATHRSIMEWTVQKGQRPEDLTRIITGLVTRANLSHHIAQFNNLVAAAQGEALANHWQRHGFNEKDMQLLKDLRLNPREIAAIRQGKMTPEIKNKIVQNQVKLTQFITEDPQRKSMFQNIPVLNQLAAYNGYSIGTAKKVTRRVNEFARAVASGDVGATSAATKRIVAMLIGMIGAGAVTIMLKNARDRKPVLPGNLEEAKTLMTDALFESAILGPTQRVYDAGRFSRDGNDYIIALFPKLRFLGDMIMAVSGLGLKKSDKELPWMENLGKRAEDMGKRLKKNVPLWKWLDPEEKSGKSPKSPKPSNTTAK